MIIFHSNETDSEVQLIHGINVRIPNRYKFINYSQISTLSYYLSVHSVQVN